MISIAEIQKREAEISKNRVKDGIPGIDLKAKEQRNLVQQFLEYYEELPFQSGKQEKARYQFDNGSYSYTDGIVLYSMIRHIQPKRIIEIGSGHSSMVMLDTNELFFENQIDLTFIEPYPERLYSLMREDDNKKATVIVSDV